MTGKKKVAEISIILVIAVLISIIYSKISSYDVILKSINSSNIHEHTELSCCMLKNDMLIGALNLYGSTSFEKVVNTFIYGIEERNGAIIYSTLSKDLKEEYLKSLSLNFPCFVIGVSSPYFDSLSSKEIYIEDDGNVAKYNLILTFTTSADDKFNYNASLTLSKEGEYYYISEIKMDRELKEYIGI